MYIHIYTPKRCSKCNSLDNYKTETEYEGLFKILEYTVCKFCEHRKLTSTTTTATTDNEAFWVNYNPQQPKEEIF